MKLYVFADKIPETCVECDLIGYDIKNECSVCSLSAREIKNAEKRESSCKLRKATKAIKKRSRKN